MAANKALERCVAVTMAMPSAANSGVGPNSGDPILIGKTPAVVSTSYTPTGGRTASGNCAVDMEGAFFLSVTAVTVLSPASGSAVVPGDAIYADGGTADGTTGVTYGFTLDKNSSTGVLFGIALDALTSGTTGVVRVRLTGAKAA